MRGGLQAYLLLLALQNRGKLARKGLESYYRTRTKPPKRKDQVGAVTKALERLIQCGFFLGHGVRSRKKWVIKELSLTPLGKRFALRLRGEQPKLPFVFTSKKR